MPTTIFWPIDVKQDGFCYGWAQPVFCVAGVTPGESRSHAQDLLESVVLSKQWESFGKLCETEPVILGICTFHTTTRSRQLPYPSLDLFQHVPDHNFIYYHRHGLKKLRFYSLDIIKIDATTGSSDDEIPPTPRNVPTENIPGRNQDKGFNSTVIHQFNTARTLEHLINSKSLESSDGPLLTSLNTKITKQITRLNCFAWIPYYLCFICRAISLLCNMAVPVSMFFSAPTFKDISATVQQIDVRSEQVDFMVHQSRFLRGHNGVHIAEYAAQYINFYNVVWLIFNDVIVGVAFGSFLCENHQNLSIILHHWFESILIGWIQWALHWLNNWPAGLKLNTELSQFYCHTFIDIVIIWGGVFRRGVPYLPSIIYIIGILSTTGMTTAVSLISDLMGLLTAHIYVCYLIATTVYHSQLKMAGSLWNLFRGKRYNVLRDRIDSWDYDTDQLLFGTMLFTLLAFLFPTVLAYYTLFAMMRLCILSLQAGMDTLLAFMNHFPLFALMQKVKDPWRIPGGLNFVKSTATPGGNHVLVIQNQSFPFSAIFSQYFRLWSRLASHYNPVRLLLRMLSGEYLAAIPRYRIRCHRVAQGDHLAVVRQ